MASGWMSRYYALDYKFEFSLQNCQEWKWGSLEYSDIFTHINGDIWQLATIKDYDGCDYRVECVLHLISSKSNAHEKPIQICIVSGEFLSTLTRAYWDGNGVYHQVILDISKDIVNSNDNKIVVEVLNDSDTPNLQLEPSKSQLVSEVLKWFDSDDFGDVTIVAADGKRFRCHREVLARRSYVFFQMFKSEMKDVVNIDDYNGDVVAQLLLFLYTGEIGPTADQLYTAAHQYKLNRLKTLYETTLAANLSADSIEKTYELANYYHLDMLLAKCVDYMDTHKAELSIEDLLADAMKIDDGNEDQMDQK